ncbi:hypothetical protein GE061_001453 [Apolygus lucorum]|uniref:Reverse transcriptase domain-containing protein n=1 Tax=Apolygus lucorum TaxID=248454 RepID=A0A8S9Y748_APOLU|nr:hypothetical protein GE061_001453 [Apolygus lucorum]
MILMWHIWRGLGMKKATHKYWSTEEMVLMAENEIRKSREGANNVEIIRYLAEVMPGRNREMIRRQRRRPVYIQIRDEMVEAGDMGQQMEAEVEAVTHRYNDEYFSAAAVALMETLQEDLLGQWFEDADEKLKEAGEQILEGQDPSVALREWCARKFGQEGRNARGNRRGGHRRQTPEIDDNLQELWNRDRRAAIDDVLSGDGRRRHVIDPTERDRGHWEAAFREPSAPFDAVVRHPTDGDFSGVWLPITQEEINTTSMGKSAAGIDGVSVSDWNKLHWKIKRTVFHIIMLRGKAPVWLSMGRTTLLPKCRCPTGPEQLRPVTVPSVMLRHFHKVLAARISGVVRHAPEQVGLIGGTDGIALNVTLLQDLLADARRRNREIHILVADVAKAFDSVSHNALMAIMRAGGWGRLVIGAECSLDEFGVPKATPNTKFKYLGMKFTPYGIARGEVGPYVAQLRKIQMSVLSPLRKLEAIRTYVMPAWLHGLVLGVWSTKDLRRIDKGCRRTVRAVLKLPGDVPNAYIYAPVGDGGLGLMEFATTIPELREKRIGQARSALFGEEAGGIVTREERKKRRAAKWHSTADGRAMRNARRTPESNAWLTGDDGRVPAWRTLAAVKTHCNAIPARARLLRGRHGSQMCRRGCDWRETSAHIVQCCPVMRRARCKRHNAVVELFAEYARRKGYATYVEMRVVAGD